MHNVYHESYPENINKKLVQEKWDELAERESDGGGGLPRDIRWINREFDSYDAALDYIEEHDSGSYDQLAVKYREKPLKELFISKKYETLKERMERLQTRYEELSSNIHYKGCKSSFISCRDCGSKLAASFFGRTIKNRCPVCSADLRPESTLEAIKTAEKNAEKARKEYREEAEKLKKRNGASVEVKWLVKVEFHS